MVLDDADVSGDSDGISINLLLNDHNQVNSLSNLCSLFKYQCVHFSAIRHQRFYKRANMLDCCGYRAIT